MRTEHGRLSQFRAGQGEIANHVIDEFAAGRLSRRDFLRRGSVAGLSLPLLGGVLAACGSSASPSPAGGSSGSGATIRVGLVQPTAAINPVTVSDQGGLVMLGQTGEYLCLSTQSLTLQPVLATSWSANSAADVWTFRIRKGVTFHNGHPLTADDVVYTFRTQSDPKSTSNALSNFGGVLDPAGVTKVDDYTVAFHLSAPNGNFPYLTSSDNYNMIIIPDGYNPADWQRTFLGTGPFVLKSYTPKVGASFTRNETYWGTKARPAGTEFTFYAAQTAENLALTSQTIDVISSFAVAGGQEILARGAYNVIRLRSSAHRELSMRCDQAPFTDPRVRQAIALALNRPQTIKALFSGYADIGNDSPFAPVYPSADTSVAQRTQNIAKAKSLLAAAGHPSGFSTQLVTEELSEIPQFAQIVVAAAKQIGVTIKLTVESSAAYYGKSTFGNSDWLDATMSLVDYGHRSVPNVFLAAPLQTTNAATGTGSWNAAHFSNSQYDSLVNQYASAVDISSQRSLAGKIEKLLLDQTPVIYPYFYNWLAATAKNVSGAYPTAIGHIFLASATKS